MKKQFLYLVLLGLLCSIGNVWGDVTFKCQLNGSVVQERGDDQSGDFFSFTFSSGSYSWKGSSDVAGCTYDGVNYTSALKFDSKPTLSFTTTEKATIIVVQSTSKNSSKAPKLDNTAMTSSESITGAKVWTKTDVAAGSHNIKYGGSEIWIHCVYVIYPTTIYDIVLDDNGDFQGNGSAKVAANGNSLTNITAPKRTGYSVSGYYAEEGCTTKIAEANGTLLANKTGFTDENGKWVATEGKTFYADWEAGKYTLTIAPNEVGWGTVSPTSVANIPYGTTTSNSSNTFTVNGTTVTATPADATAEYTYAFSKWTDLPATVAEDATVTATFARTPVNYNLAWDANGDGASLSGEYTNGSTPFGTTIVKPTATRTGYALVGWAETADGDAVNVTTMPAANTTYYAKWTEVVAPTFNVNYTNVSTPQNVTITFTASAVTGTPAPTVTWYQSATAVASGGTSKGTGNSYSPDVSTIGTYYFYAVASNGVEPDANSGVITLTVAPKLNSLVYSNGFKAFIQQPSAGNGKIKAYYIAGTEVPTISSFTATTGATYNVDGNTLTLTAADGVTTAIFDITLEPVTPYSGTGEYTFTKSDSWVKAGNSFDAGWKIARSYENDSEKKFMVSTGSNRAYLFLAPSTSITVTQNSGNNKRDMYVSIDGGAPIEKTDETFTITGKDNAAYMVEISQKNSNGGDGKIKIVSITKTGFESGIISELGWNSFASSSKLNLSDMAGGTAYAVSSVSESSATLTEFGNVVVAAGTGMLINGTPYAAYKISTSTEAVTFVGTNKLVGTTSAISGDDLTALSNPYVLGKVDDEAALCKFTGSSIPANKAYLPSGEVPTLAPGIRFIIGENNNATNLQNVEANEKAVKFIENGQILILRDGIVYDALGRKVR